MDISYVPNPNAIECIGLCPYANWLHICCYPYNVLINAYSIPIHFVVQSYFNGFLLIRDSLAWQSCTFLTLLRSNRDIFLRNAKISVCNNYCIRLGSRRIFATMWTGYKTATVVVTMTMIMMMKPHIRILWSWLFPDLASNLNRIWVRW